MSEARDRRSDGVSWPMVLSLLRFNICTFSFLVVVTIPQPNLCGACIPFIEMVPATWPAYDAHSRTLRCNFSCEGQPPRNAGMSTSVSNLSTFSTCELRGSSPTTMARVCCGVICQAHPIASLVSSIQLLGEYGRNSIDLITPAPY
jgi:hypothetical protein